MKITEAREKLGSKVEVVGKIIKVEPTELSASPNGEEYLKQKIRIKDETDDIGFTFYPNEKNKAFEQSDIRKTIKVSSTVKEYNKNRYLSGGYYNYIQDTTIPENLNPKGSPKPHKDSGVSNKTDVKSDAEKKYWDDKQSRELRSKTYNSAMMVVCGGMKVSEILENIEEVKKVIVKLAEQGVEFYINHGEGIGSELETRNQQVEPEDVVETNDEEIPF